MNIDQSAVFHEPAAIAEAHDNEVRFLFKHVFSAINIHIQFGYIEPPPPPVLQPQDDDAISEITILHLEDGAAPAALVGMRRGIQVLEVRVLNFCRCGRC